MSACGMQVRGGSPEALQLGLGQHLGELEHARQVGAVVGHFVHAETASGGECTGQRAAGRWAWASAHLRLVNEELSKAAAIVAAPFAPRTQLERLCSAATEKHGHRER